MGKAGVQARAVGGYEVCLMMRDLRPLFREIRVREKRILVVMIASGCERARNGDSLTIQLLSLLIEHPGSTSLCDAFPLDSVRNK